METRDMALGMAAGRTVIGASAFLFPGTMSAWVGDAARLPGTRLALRAFGGRDLALGVGTLLALEHDAPVRGWVEAGMLADAVDAIATAAAFRRLPRWGRWVALGAAASGVAFGRYLAARLD